MRFAVLVFPGSNCDIDCYKAVEETIGQPVDYVWHTATDLSPYDCILVPGGFSYGDYLRCGAISIRPGYERSGEGGGRGQVYSCSNGISDLTEAGLLPGALRRNDSMKFRCHDTVLKVNNNTTPFTLDYAEGQEIVIPIAHGEGNYYCDEETLQSSGTTGKSYLRIKTIERLDRGYCRYLQRAAT